MIAGQAEAGVKLQYRELGKIEGEAGVGAFGGLIGVVGGCWLAGVLFF